MPRPIRLKVLLPVMVGLLILTPGRTAAASDSCSATYRVVWVTNAVDREVSYTKMITLYDSCGRPDNVEKTCTNTVSVPVRVRVVVYE